MLKAIQVSVKAIFNMVVALTLLLSVTGCGNFVNEPSIKKAMDLCASNGGLNHLSIFVADKAVCNNGAIYHRGNWMVRDR